MKNNCSRRQVCDISSTEIFQTPGPCGAGGTIRNWIHIKHTCYGDIPGVRCHSTTTTTSPTTTTSKAVRTIRVGKLYLNCTHLNWGHNHSGQKQVRVSLDFQANNKCHIGVAHPRLHTLVARWKLNMCR